MRTPRNEGLGAPTTKSVRPERSRGTGAQRVSRKPVLSNAAGGVEGLDTNGAGAEKHAPERTCVLTRASGSRDALIRLALSPDGEVHPDVRARAPGRGAWIGVGRAELDDANSKGRLKAVLQRAFKTQAVSVPADLGERIAAALRQAVLDRLGMEARAGNVVTGAERIDDAARSGKVAMLIHAADAGEDGARRLDQGWRVGGGAERGVIFPEGRTILSMALGRENVVHLALTDPAAATRVRHALSRWRAFCDPDRGLDGGSDTARKTRSTARPAPTPAAAETIVDVKEENG